MGAFSTIGAISMPVNPVTYIPITPDESGQNFLGQEIVKKIVRLQTGTFIVISRTEIWQKEGVISLITVEQRGPLPEPLKSHSKSWMIFKQDIYSVVENTSIRKSGRCSAEITPAFRCIPPLVAVDRHPAPDYSPSCYSFRS